MLEENYKQYLSEDFSDIEKEIIIKDLYFLSELILDSEDLMKVINQIKV